ncbi:hypothetical protein HAX54_028646 [Datura stramonium]|uniref:Uncharacterized protein n=1 Tax=Datura stramonium TaxID=4076 RepID=A0ABS8V4H0_DATST|nr:hypothetical protein [Datura stramonium]
MAAKECIAISFGNSKYLKFLNNVVLAFSQLLGFYCSFPSHVLRTPLLVKLKFGCTACHQTPFTHGGVGKRVSEEVVLSEQHGRTERQDLSRQNKSQGAAIQGSSTGRLCPFELLVSLEPALLSGGMARATGPSD